MSLQGVKLKGALGVLAVWLVLMAGSIHTSTAQTSAPSSSITTSSNSAVSGADGRAECSVLQGDISSKNVMLQGILQAELLLGQNETIVSVVENCRRKEHDGITAEVTVTIVTSTDRQLQTNLLCTRTGVDGGITTEVTAATTAAGGGVGGGTSAGVLSVHEFSFPSLTAEPGPCQACLNSSESCLACTLLCENGGALLPDCSACLCIDNYYGQTCQHHGNTTTTATNTTSPTPATTATTTSIFSSSSESNKQLTSTAPQDTNTSNATSNTSRTTSSSNSNTSTTSSNSSNTSSNSSSSSSSNSNSSSNTSTTSNTSNTSSTSSTSNSSTTSSSTGNTSSTSTTSSTGNSSTTSSNSSNSSNTSSTSSSSNSSNSSTGNSSGTSSNSSNSSNTSSSSSNSNNSSTGNSSGTSSNSSNSSSTTVSPLVVTTNTSATSAVQDLVVTPIPNTNRDSVSLSATPPIPNTATDPAYVSDPISSTVATPDFATRVANQSRSAASTINDTIMANTSIAENSTSSTNVQRQTSSDSPAALPVSTDASILMVTSSPSTPVEMTSSVSISSQATPSQPNTVGMTSSSSPTAITGIQISTLLSSSFPQPKTEFFSSNQSTAGTETGTMTSSPPGTMTSSETTPSSPPPPGTMTSSSSSSSSSSETKPSSPPGTMTSSTSSKTMPPSPGTIISSPQGTMTSSPSSPPGTITSSQQVPMTPSLSSEAIPSSPGVMTSPGTMTSLPGTMTSPPSLSPGSMTTSQLVTMTPSLSSETMPSSPGIMSSSLPGTMTSISPGTMTSQPVLMTPSLSSEAMPSPVVITSSPGTMTSSPLDDMTLSGTINISSPSGVMTSSPGTMTSSPPDAMTSPGTVISSPGVEISSPGTVISSPGTMLSSPSSAMTSSPSSETIATTIYATQSMPTKVAIDSTHGITSDSSVMTSSVPAATSPQAEYSTTADSTTALEVTTSETTTVIGNTTISTTVPQTDISSKVTSSTAEIASPTAGITSSTAGNTSSTSGITSSTAGITSSTAEIASSTAEIASSTAGIASSTAGIASSTAEIASSTAGIASSTAGNTSSTVGISSSTAGIASSTAGIASSTAGITSPNTPAAGYTDSPTSESSSPCIPSPCLNNSTCVAIDNRLMCVCPEGFHGDRCQKKIAKCRCNDVGACQDEYTHESCSCPPGLTGTLCETRMSPCSSLPCASNATCAASGESYLCRCPVGYEGDVCNKTQCSAKPCENDALCLLDRQGQYNCTCSRGWTGENCTDPVLSVCSVHGCSENRVCDRSAENCVCKAGHIGPNCVKTAAGSNECLSAPCSNGAACIDTRDGYTCKCLNGYYGSRCDACPQTCTQNKERCGSNGRCETVHCPRFNNLRLSDSIPVAENEHNGTRCICDDGYYGEYCQYQLHQCGEVDACENGGTCKIRYGAEGPFAQCMCELGWSGTTCSECTKKCIHGNVDKLCRMCMCKSGWEGESCDECSGVIQGQECLPQCTTPGFEPTTVMESKHSACFACGIHNCIACNRPPFVLAPDKTTEDPSNLEACTECEPGSVLSKGRCIGPQDSAVVHPRGDRIVIIAVIVGVSVLVLLLIIIACCIIRRRRRERVYKYKTSAYGGDSSLITRNPSAQQEHVELQSVSTFKQQPTQSNGSSGGAANGYNKARMLDHLSDEFPTLRMISIANAVQKANFDEDAARDILSREHQELQRRQSLVYMHLGVSNGHTATDQQQQLEQEQRHNPFKPTTRKGSMSNGSTSTAAASAPVFVASSANRAGRRISVQEDSMDTMTLAVEQEYNASMLRGTRRSTSTNQTADELTLQEGIAEVQQGHALVETTDEITAIEVQQDLERTNNAPKVRRKSSTVFIAMPDDLGGGTAVAMRPRLPRKVPDMDTNGSVAAPMVFMSGASHGGVTQVTEDGLVPQATENRAKDETATGDLSEYNNTNTAAEAEAEAVTAAPAAAAALAESNAAHGTTSQDAPTHPSIFMSMPAGRNSHTTAIPDHHGYGSDGDGDGGLGAGTDAEEQRVAEKERRISMVQQSEFQPASVFISGLSTHKNTSVHQPKETNADGIADDEQFMADTQHQQHHDIIVNNDDITVTNDDITAASGNPEGRRASSIFISMPTSTVTPGDRYTKAMERDRRITAAAEVAAAAHTVGDGNSAHEHSSGGGNTLDSSAFANVFVSIPKPGKAVSLTHHYDNSNSTPPVHSNRDAVRLPKSPAAAAANTPVLSSVTSGAGGGYPIGKSPKKNNNIVVPSPLAQVSRPPKPLYQQQQHQHQYQHHPQHQHHHQHHPHHHPQQHHLTHDDPMLDTVPAQTQLSSSRDSLGDSLGSMLSQANPSARSSPFSSPSIHMLTTCSVPTAPENSPMIQSPNILNTSPVHGASVKDRFLSPRGSPLKLLSPLAETSVEHQQYPALHSADLLSLQ
ncbi:uncharacterized protein LOC135826568 [Sycon ciliatum]|uniref:uncharacterized protein LOC135826568 n=1 Tax=Sycon ciliatum TaxID=27933 RepID=UPI0031F709D8